MLRCHIRSADRIDLLANQAFTAALDGVSFNCDVVKTWRLVLFAMVVMGPVIHYWNRILEYVFFGWDPVAAVAVKAPPSHAPESKPS